MKEPQVSASILISCNIATITDTGRKAMNQGEDGYLYLPDLGEVNEVTIVEWLKAEGEDFSAGEDLVEVETEKTTFIVDAPTAGRIERILIKSGEKAHFGDKLAKLAS